METIHLIVLILHVIVACLLLGMAFYSLIAVLKTPIAPNNFFMFKTIQAWGKPLAGSQLILGIILVWMEPEAFAHNSLIWAKFVLYILAGYLSVAVIKRKIELLDSEKNNPQLERSLTGVAWALFIIVLLIVVIGVIAAETTKG
jgi:uncharacterized membrane protein